MKLDQATYQNYVKTCQRHDLPACSFSEWKKHEEEAASMSCKPVLDRLLCYAKELQDFLSFMPCSFEVFPSPREGGLSVVKFYMDDKKGIKQAKDNSSLALDRLFAEIPELIDAIPPCFCFPRSEPNCTYVLVPNDYLVPGEATSFGEEFVEHLANWNSLKKTSENN